MTAAAHIQLEVIGAGLRVEFADRGRPFDPTRVAAPDLTVPLSAREPGGLGLHLVRQVMPRVEYRRDGDWNRITLERPLSGQAPTKAEL